MKRTLDNTYHPIFQRAKFEMLSGRQHKCQSPYSISHLLKARQKFQPYTLFRSCLASPRTQSAKECTVPIWYPERSCKREGSWFKNMHPAPISVLFVYQAVSWYFHLFKLYYKNHWRWWLKIHFQDPPPKSLICLKMAPKIGKLWRRVVFLKCEWGGVSWRFCSMRIHMQ